MSVAGWRYGVRGGQETSPEFGKGDPELAAVGRRAWAETGDRHAALIGTANLRPIRGAIAFSMGVF